VAGAATGVSDNVTPLRSKPGALYPSKEALDAAMASGEKSGMGETFEQLDALLVALDAALRQR
jgi:hypothetical protein